MPRTRNFALLFSFALLAASVQAGAKDAPLKKEPVAQKQSAARGGAVEKQLNDKRGVKTQAPSPKKLPPNAEIRKTLIKGDRPAVRFLLKKQAETSKSSGGYGLMSAGAASKNPAPQYPQHKNKLENDRIRPPKQFEVEYDLAADAEVRFTLSNAEGVPVATTAFEKGAVGAREGKNKRIVWDGRDESGKEAPLGDYSVLQEIDYGQDAVERRVFTLTK
jgi:hypothetical protein